MIWTAVAVAFEALNVAVFSGRLARFLDISSQRRDQIGQITAGGAGLFEQDLEEVQVIRQRPLVVLEEQLAADDAAVVENSREQGLEAATCRPVRSNRSAA